MKSIIFTLAFTTLVVCFSGCASSNITSTWKAKDHIPVSYNRIMVLGIIKEPDRSIRVSMEGHLVEDLRAQGLNAFSAFDEYGPKAFDGMTEEQAAKKLAADSIDAVLTVVLLDKTRERHYMPGSIVYTPYMTYHNHFYRYYNSLYMRIESPGYYSYSTRYFWESNLFDLKENRLIFSAQTQSFAPSSIESLAHEYGQGIVQSLVRNNVLKPISGAPKKTI